MRRCTPSSTHPYHSFLRSLPTQTWATLSQCSAPSVTKPRSTNPGPPGVAPTSSPRMHHRNSDCSASHCTGCTCVKQDRKCQCHMIHGSPTFLCVSWERPCQMCVLPESLWTNCGLGNAATRRSMCWIQASSTHFLIKITGEI